MKHGGCTMHMLRSLADIQRTCALHLCFSPEPDLTIVIPVGVGAHVSVE
jgi:hypothetical protein